MEDRLVLKRRYRNAESRLFMLCEKRLQRMRRQEQRRAAAEAKIAKSVEAVEEAAAAWKILELGDSIVTTAVWSGTLPATIPQAPSDGTGLISGYYSFDYGTNVTSGSIIVGGTGTGTGTAVPCSTLDYENFVGGSYGATQTYTVPYVTVNSETGTWAINYELT